MRSGSLRKYVVVDMTVSEGGVYEFSSGKSAIRLCRLLKETLGHEYMFYTQSTLPDLDFDMVDQEWRAEQEGSDVVIDEEQPSTEETLALYDAVGWHCDPDELMTGLGETQWLMTARRNRELVGLTRALTDYNTNVYVVDLLVHPDHQNTGVGGALLDALVRRSCHIRRFVMLSQDDERLKGVLRVPRAAGVTWTMAPGRTCKWRPPSWPEDSGRGRHL